MIKSVLNVIVVAFSFVVPSLCIHADGITSQNAPCTFVIVPGAWGGGWDWKTVDRFLSDDGHKVYRLTLTGLGERAHLSGSEINLTTHISDVVNVIMYEDLHDIILVGHSYGGMVITGVMNRIPDRIRRAIFLDAALPDDGQNFYDVCRKDARIDEKVVDGMIIPSWLDTTRPPPFYVPQPVKTWTERVSFNNPSAKTVSATYVLFANRGEALEKASCFPSLQRAKARGWTTRVLESDHMAHLSHPKELVALLEQLSRSTNRPIQAPQSTTPAVTPPAGQEARQP